MSEWKQLTLKEAGVTLIDCVHKTPEAKSSGIPYIGIPQLKNGHISFESNPRLISEEDYYEWTKKANPRHNDVILSRRTNPGVTAYVPENKQFALGQNLVLMRSNGKVVFPEYLRWLLQGPHWWGQVEKFLNVGAVFDSLKISDVPKFELPIPPFSEQKAIAHILSTLDEKIELNRKMNQTLESMAQALFKSWFVDFDPVIDNAILAGNEIPEELQARVEKRRRVIAREERPKQSPAEGRMKQSPSALKPLLRTNPSLAAQFPASFFFNETLGKWIPEGWEVKSFGEFVKIIKGKSYKSSELEDSKTALVTLKSFERGGGYRLDGLKEYTGSYKPEQEVFAGDLIIAYTDVTQAADLIGKPAIIIENRKYEHLVISLDVAVIRPKKESLKFFFYGLAMTNEFQSHTYSHTSGTTVLHLGKDAVGSYQFSFAGFQIIEEYDRKVKSIFKRINQTIQEIETLTQLRDRLLPELISGRVRVKVISQ